MKNLLITFFIFSNLFLFSQNKCKHVKSELDDMTGVEKIYTKTKELFAQISDKDYTKVDYVNFSISHVKEKYILALALSSSFPIEVKDKELLIKIDKDNFVKLKPIKTSSVTYNNGRFSTSVAYVLNQEDILELSSNDIEKIRIYINDYYWQSTNHFTTRRSDRLKEMLICLMEKVEDSK